MSDLAYFAAVEAKRGITRAPGLTRFRPHRGSLVKAMEEVVEVKGLAGLIDYLRKEHPAFGKPFDQTAITVEPYGGDDERIGWKNVHIVVMKDYGPIGFCEGPLI